MVREGCNAPTVAWSTFRERLPRVLSRHALDFNKSSVYSIYVRIQPNNSNQYFSLSSQVWKLFPSKPPSALELLKMECGVNGRFGSRRAHTPFLFHLATGRHKYYSASNRYGDHEEEAEEQLKTISANFPLLHLLKRVLPFISSKLHPKVPLSTAVTHVSTHSHTRTHKAPIMTTYSGQHWCLFLGNDFKVKAEVCVRG